MNSEAIANLRLVAEGMLPADAVDEFCEEVGLQSGLIWLHRQERLLPGREEAKHLRADIKALERVIALFERDDNADRSVVRQLCFKLKWLRMPFEKAKEAGVKPTVKRTFAEEVCAAIAAALDIPLYRLSAGGDPDLRGPTGELPLLVAAMEAAGLNETHHQTRKRLQGVIADAKRSRELEEMS